MPEITSLDNPLVKQIRQLHDAHHRRATHQCVVEGKRAIASCLEAGWIPNYIFITNGNDVPSEWLTYSVIHVASRVGIKLSQAHTPSGYVAVFTQPTLPPLDIAAGGLVLVGMSDPGNVGTLIRCAAAFALPQVVLIGGADPYAHKVLQSTAGTFTATHVYRFDDGQGVPVFSGGAPCCALVVRGGKHPQQLTPGPRWLVVGSEAHGLQPSVLAVCGEQLTLPMPGQAESLNAAMAGAIACYALFAAATPG